MAGGGGGGGGKGSSSKKKKKTPYSWSSFLHPKYYANLKFVIKDDAAKPITK